VTDNFSGNRQGCTPSPAWDSVDLTLRMRSNGSRVVWCGPMQVPSLLEEETAVMDCSKTITRSRRHVLGAAAVGAVLSLSPILVLSGPSAAQGPTIAVSGLARGDRGDSVRSVQQALVNQGVEVAGGVDGVFGPGTEAAVKAFQGKQGLPQSGMVDDATAIALGLASSPFLGLTQGARGDAVRELQQRLATAGFAPSGGADGIFGPATKTALAAFQTSKRVAATGSVDAATAATLALVPATAGSTASDQAATAGQQAARQPDTAQPSGSALVGLRIGSRGEAVKSLQQTIMKAGFSVVGGADGIFGVLTATALKSFQNANGLETSGVVDEATAAALATVGTGSGDTAHDPTITTSPLLGLRYGSIGSDVKALQEALIAAGIALRGGADGVFGPATQAALRQYQQTKGLTQSGVVDDATASVLASTNGGSTSPTTSALVGLKAGALGNTVKQLQQAMIDAGIKVRGGADGIFGPATKSALEAFQTSQGLSVTGIVDAATAAALAAPKPVGAQNPVPGGSGGFAEYGEKGPRVIALQTALVAAGISVRGGVDGDFGGGTSAAVMEFQRQRGLTVTGRVDDATGAALGLEKTAAPAAPDASKVQLKVFPVQGRCSYGDSWGYPRSGGRVHLGVDIIAAQGKLLYAVVDGKIDKVYHDHPGSLAGNGVRLRMADGTYFFYAHMQSIADGIDVGVPVKAGQILGAVGNTGSSGTPHLHFEVHPQGGAAVNPYPLVKAIDGCSITDPLPQP
jgi:peptidoglycan hydrolase-like protein with peptidoglycan-binding domain